MGLNITSSGGAFAPTVKFNAKLGQWTFRAPDIDQMNIDPPKALFDFKNLQTGWLHFVPGRKPLRTFDPVQGQMCEKVDPEQKRGFMMNIYSTHFPVPGAAEFASTAANVAGPIDALFDQYTAGAAANPGKLPLVTVSPAVAAKGGHNNFSPVFSIEGWYDRPADFPDALPCPDEIGRVPSALNGAGGHVSAPPPPAPAQSAGEDLPF